MANKPLTVEDVKEALLSGISPLKPTELVDLILAKNRKQLIKRIKKYVKKYS
jgi:hypothetical protein